jgi:hypothetical protein
MANEFLIFALFLLGMIAPFAAMLGLFMTLFDAVFPSRDYKPRPIANKLQLIRFLLIVVPSCLSLLFRLAIA